MFLAIILPSSSCSSYGGPQLSGQNQKPHGKNKNIMAKPKTSRQKQNTSWQNQKPHGKNKIPHSKTKNLTAKPNTSQRKQNSFGFAMGICFYRKVFGFCCEVFGFAMRSLGLPWGFWFCREVFCFCCGVFGFAVRFLFLTWGFRFCHDHEVFCFCREVFGFAVIVVGHRKFLLLKRVKCLPFFCQNQNNSTSSPGLLG